MIINPEFFSHFNLTVTGDLLKPLHMKITSAGGYE